ncbi:MAG: hypothetical protein HY683_01970 [Chloroflexi bacterium]|nr:hypothetical protein [Chloroflexota bacterium]
MYANKTMAKLRAGQTAVGFSMSFQCPEMVEVLGALGFDYVTFDLEHEPYDERDIVNSIRAAEVYGLTPIVRAPYDPDLFLRLLDAGAQGIHVPRVNTAEDAKRVVEAVRFHPQGTRTFYTTGRGGHYGIGVSEAEFAEASNRETLLVLQVEEVEGIRNLTQVLAVPGIDAIQFGPKDLRQSMGFPDPTKVWQVIEEALRTTTDAGKWASMVAWMGADPNSGKMARYRELGVRMITGQSPEFVIAGAQQFLRQAAAGKAPPAAR